MKIQVTNLLLLGSAFVVAGMASATGISQYDGGDLSGFLTLGSLALFATTASLLWSFGVFRGQRAEWNKIAESLVGDYSVSAAGVHGQYQGMPVYARVESPANNAEYLDRTCAMYSCAKHFFTLTVTLPYNDLSAWRVLYQPKNTERPHGHWAALCENSGELSRSLEMAGVVDLFSEWHKLTVLKCNAQVGELTLRYPAPHRNFCPTPDEVEKEIKLLQRIADIWQHVAHRRLAA